MTWRSSCRIRSRPSRTALDKLAVLTFWLDSALRTSDSGRRTPLMGKRIDDLVDHHLIGERGPLDVAGIVLGIRPLHAVAHVGVPVDEDQRPAGVVENAAQMRDEAALL